MASTSFNQEPPCTDCSDRHLKDLELDLDHLFKQNPEDRLFKPSIERVVDHVATNQELHNNLIKPLLHVVSHARRMDEEDPRKSEAVARQIADAFCRRFLSHLGHGLDNVVGAASQTHGITISEGLDDWNVELSIHPKHQIATGEPVHRSDSEEQTIWHDTRQDQAVDADEEAQGLDEEEDETYGSPRTQWEEEDETYGSDPFQPDDRVDIIDAADDNMAVPASPSSIIGIASSSPNRIVGRSVGGATISGRRPSRRTNASQAFPGSGSSKWTDEEDKLVMRGIRKGVKSSDISKAYRLRRSNSAIRGRLSLLKKKYPDWTVPNGDHLHDTMLGTSKLVNEVLGPLQFAPTAQQLLSATSDDIPREKLDRLYRLLEQDPAARIDLNALLVKLGSHA